VENDPYNPCGDNKLLMRGSFRQNAKMPKRQNANTDIFVV